MRRSDSTKEKRVINPIYLKAVVLITVIAYLLILIPHLTLAEERGFSRMAAQEPLILPPQEEGKIIPQEKAMSKPFYKKWWFWTLALVIGGGAAAASGGGGGDSDNGGGGGSGSTGSVGVTW